MVDKIDKKQCSIDLLHSKLKHINAIDNTGLLEVKKKEEPKELTEAIEKLIEAIENVHSELADCIIVNRDSIHFDYRFEVNRQLTKHGIFKIVRLLRCEEEILKHCHEKVDRTIKRIEGGYYDKV